MGVVLRSRIARKRAGSKEKENTHSFKKSLRRGQKGESEFESLFGDKVERLDGFICDFRIKRTGKFIELKTDSYDPTKTSNFFMEKYSYGNEPGGPFQAKKKGADFFVYFFPMTNEFYVFRTAALVKYLEENYPTPFLINVFNKAHTTRGFKVPRAELEHLCVPLQEIL